MIHSGPRLALPLGRGPTGTRSTSPAASGSARGCTRSSAAAEPALLARPTRCLAIRRGGAARSTGTSPSAYEAMARASAVAGDADRGRRLEGQGDVAALDGDRRPGRSRAHRGRPRDAAVARRLHSGPPHAHRRPVRCPTSSSGSCSGARRRPGAEMLDAARAGRSSRLRPPLDVGPPLRDLRRPVPADLRGLVAAQRLGARDRADPARAARRRQHVPQPGPRRQDRRDARPRQRRPGDPGHRRGVDGAGAQAHGIDFGSGVRPAARLARRSRSARCARLLDGETVTSEPGGHYAFDDAAPPARCRSSRTCRS